jgi:hypothetical protein
LFSDEEQQGKKDRDPVALAKRSTEALKKVHSQRLDGGTEAHSFHTLLMDLATIGYYSSVARCAGSRPTNLLPARSSLNANWN